MMVIKSYKELGRVPEVGDRIMIVNEKNGGPWNCMGEMDKYLGSTMTVKRLRYAHSLKSFAVDVYEDISDNGGIGWAWTHEMIQGVVIEEYEDLVDDTSLWALDASVEDLLS